MHNWFNHMFEREAILLNCMENGSCDFNSESGGGGGGGGASLATYMQYLSTIWCS